MDTFGDLVDLAEDLNVDFYQIKLRRAIAQTMVDIIETAAEQASENPNDE